MAKKQDDGTITLAQANAEARKADRAYEAEVSRIQKAAHRAIDSAFKAPARRTRKNLRG